jgi:hypothetical protein
MPVPAAACASVPSLHDAAERVLAEREYVESGYVLGPVHWSPLGLYATPVRASWPVSRSRLHDDLDALDSAIARAAPAFPTAIRRQFVIVRRGIATGRRELALSGGVAELLDKTVRSWNKLMQAFASASDLVGAQCGAPLGAGAPLFSPCDLMGCPKP